MVHHTKKHRKRHSRKRNNTKRQVSRKRRETHKRRATHKRSVARERRATHKRRDRSKKVRRAGADAWADACCGSRKKRETRPPVRQTRQSATVDEDWEPPVASLLAPKHMNPRQWKPLSRNQMNGIKHHSKKQKQIDLMDAKREYNNSYDQGASYHNLPDLRRKIRAETTMLKEIKLGERHDM